RRRVAADPPAGRGDSQRVPADAALRRDHAGARRCHRKGASAGRRGQAVRSGVARMRGAPDPRHGLDTVGDPVAEREQWLAARAPDRGRGRAPPIRARRPPVPRPPTVLGWGLGGPPDAPSPAPEGAARPTADLPHWPRSTVTGHAGRLVLGTWRGVLLAVLA